MYIYIYVYVLYTDWSERDCRVKIEFRGGGREMIVGNILTDSHSWR